RRFPVVARDREAFDQVNAKLLALTPADLRPGVCPVSDADVDTFINESINSPALVEHLRSQRDAYQAFIFMPYMFGLVVRGLPVVADRAYLQPCLHDEPQAYFPAVEELFRTARLVLFNSEGERELAARLYSPAIFPRSIVTGEGVERINAPREEVSDALPADLCAAPFVLYLGRRDETKNTPLVIRAFRRFKERAHASKLKLVVAGAGAISFDDRAGDVFDLGLVNEETKAALLTSCRALFQPSRRESFSRALMEAWSRGRPVAAHRECLATAIAVERARGGWLAGTQDEWAETFARVASASDAELDELGARGRAYADEHADWDKVIERYEQLLTADETSGQSKIVGAGLVPARSTSAGVRLQKQRHGQGQALPLQTIHQLLPDIVYGDAISNQAVAVRDYLRGRGFESEIFVKRREERVAHEARLFDPSAFKPSDALIYHHSIGSELTAFAVGHAGAKCLVYHNITPAEYFAPYRPGFAWMLETGRAHLPRLARHFQISVGDSAYNAAELAACGFASPGVLPIICDPAKWNVRADAALMERLQDGKVNLLYVGRIAPNKKQDELVEAFALYRELDARSRLVIAGEGRASDPFYARLLRAIRQHDLAEHVAVTGQITDAELLAYYRTAHLYWSLSEHEGFGVPLVEAMWFDIPVLAYSRAAVPETLGDAGLTFDSKQDLREVATLAKLLTRDDENLRRRVIDAGRARREAFTPASVHMILEELIARMESRAAQPAEEVA
ncbi:MAG TPA: glycosyltransferase, partial [Pyrinomonadaceae bacterium]|nr:glycosyltransferase [Pyrinomonadaceae bacterium]